MIPRHPGDPERLPKVSRGAGAARACSDLGAAGDLGRGLPDTPSPAPTARPTWPRGQEVGPSGLQFGVASAQGHIFRGGEERLF